MAQLRVASVGLGWWGKELARGARAAGLEVVSCYARTEETRNAFATEVDCKPSSRLEEVLADPTIDALLIATPQQGGRAVSRHGRSVSIDEATALVFEFASGAVGTLVTSFFTPWRISLALQGTMGAAFADRDGATLGFQPRGENRPTEIPLHEVDAVADQLVEFANCVREGKRPEVSGAEGLAVVAVLEAAKRSVATGSFEEVEPG